MRLLLAIVLACDVALWAQPAVPGQAEAAAAAQEAATAAAGEISSAQDWRFAHPGATVIGGVNLKQLLSSPLVERLMRDQAPTDPETALMMGLAEAALGQLQQVRFSIQQNGTNTPETLLLVEGPIDDSLLEMASQAAAEQSADLAGDPLKLPDAAVAEAFAWRRIDANTVLMGSLSGLDEAVARLSGLAGLSPSASNLAGGATLNASHDFWISGAVPDAPATAGVDQQVDGFALGFSLSEDLELEAAVVIPDLAQAQMLMDMLSGLMAGQTEQFTGQLNTSLDQTSVPGKATARVSMRVPANDIVRAMSQVQTSSGEEPFVGEAPPPVGANSSGSGTKGAGKVVIQGLDDGPREIPYRK